MNRNCRRKTEKAFPRPRGGDPIWLNGLVGAGYFSPHVRGSTLTTLRKKQIIGLS